jgi:sulfite exporter TauE/SafE
MTPWFESFVFGLANSLHCACMCGPLAAAFHGGASDAVGYQCGRAISYGALGVVLGATGAVLGASSLGAPTAWVAFVFAAALIVLALLGERGAASLPGAGRLLQRAMSGMRRLPPGTRSLVLGLLTPFLPCGLLWSACAGASVAGSATAGGVAMLGFALGGVPLLLLAQLHVGPLARRFGPRTLALVTRGAMLVAAGVLVWRGIAAQHGGCCAACG